MGSAVMMGPTGDSVWTLTANAYNPRLLYCTLPDDVVELVFNFLTTSQTADNAATVVRGRSLEHVVLNNLDYVTRLEASCGGLTRNEKTIRITLNGSTRNVTSFGAFLGDSGAVSIVDGDPIDLRSATRNPLLLSYAYNLREIRFVPNTSNVPVSFDHAYVLSLESLVSAANCLKVITSGTTVRVHGVGDTLQALGRIESRTDDTGTYNFFIADENNGTTTVQQFIESKGWTVSTS